MDKLEENKKIVQEGLNKRAEKRNKAAKEAEQETITIQIFNIVNKNASNAEMEKQIVHDALATNKKKKKVAALKRQGNATIKSLYASAILFGMAIILHIVGVTELWSAIATSVLAATMFIFNIIVLIENANKLSNLT